MAVTTITTAAQIREFRGEWEQLHCESQGHPFTHPVWALAWLEAFSPARARIVVERDADGGVQAVLPLAESRRAGDLVTLGHPLVDFGMPLHRPEPDPVAGITRTLAATPGWRSVRLVGLREEDARAVVGAAAEVALDARARPGDDCPWIDVPSRAAWEAALPAARRKRLRSVVRRARRLGCELHHVVEPAQAAGALRRFESLRLQSWWHAGRLRELPRQARGLEHGRLFSIIGCEAGGTLLTVAELRSGARPLASAVLLWSEASVLVAVAATDKRLGAQLSPGLALDVGIIGLAAERGVRRVELGRGDEPYKFSLGAQSRRTCDVIVTRRAWRGRPQWPGRT